MLVNLTPSQKAQFERLRLGPACDQQIKGPARRAINELRRKKLIRPITGRHIGRSGSKMYWVTYEWLTAFNHSSLDKHIKKEEQIMKQPKPRIFLHPGYVVSTHKEPTYVGIGDLLNVYKLQMHECHVIDSRRPETFMGLGHRDDDIHLYPHRSHHVYEQEIRNLNKKLGRD